MLNTRVRTGWVMLAVLQLADIATTALALSTRAATEANATARAVMSAYGQPAAYIIKAAGIALVLAALWRYQAHRWTRVVLWSALTITAITVASNTAWLFVHYRP